MNSLRASLCLFLALDQLTSALTYRIAEDLRGFGPSQNGRFKRFSIRNKDTLKWNKRKLSYHFLSFSSKMDAAATRSEFARAAEEWSRYSGLDFQEDTDKADLLLSFGTGQHGDILIDPPFDGRSGRLAHAFPPDGSRVAGDIHFDDDEDWAVNSTDDAKTDFYSVALHELGHSLGLSHSEAAESVMSADYGDRLKTNMVRLQPDDIEGIRTLYAHFIQTKPIYQPTTLEPWGERISTTKRSEKTITTNMPKLKNKPSITSTTIGILTETARIATTTRNNIFTSTTAKNDIKSSTTRIKNSYHTTNQPSPTKSAKTKQTELSTTPKMTRNHTLPTATKIRDADPTKITPPLTTKTPTAIKPTRNEKKTVMKSLDTTDRVDETSKSVTEISGRDRNKINDDPKLKIPSETTQKHPEEQEPNFGVAVVPTETPIVPVLGNSSTPTEDLPQPSGATTLTHVGVLWSTLYVLYLSNAILI